MQNTTADLSNPPPACLNSTDLQFRCITGGDERAVSRSIAGWVSGGGFSNVTLRPSWQADAVDAYLRSGVRLPDESLWNRSGRAIPDVTAQGWNGYVVNGGEPTLVSGTSMSTPIVATIFALLHHDYYQITNTTLGFLNPLLFVAQTHTLAHSARTVPCAVSTFSFADARLFVPRVLANRYKGQAAGAGLFHDITQGDNCNDDECKDGHVGFEATKGWDPVSGLGSPVYPAMRKYVQQLGRRVVERRERKQQMEQSM